MFLSENTPLVAVDIGSHSVKVAQLAKLKKGDQFELMNFGVMPLEEESVVDGVVKKPDEVVETLTQLLKAEKIQTSFAVSSVAGEAVIVKKIKVPVMPEEELLESIDQEAEQYIPFDIEDVRIDFQILGGEKRAEKIADEETVSDEESGQTPVEDSLEGEEGNEEKMEILLVAVQRDIIESRTDVLMDAGLKPVIVDLDVFALVNAVNLSTDISSMGAIALVDMGDSFTHLNILMNGVSVLSRDIPIGGGQCSRRLTHKLEVPASQVDAVKLGKLPAGVESENVVEIILNSHEKILEEVKKSFEFFGTTSGTQVSKMFISGGGALIRGTDGYFSEHLEVPVEILDPMKALKINPKQFDQELIETLAPLSAVVVGLATRRFDYK